MVDECDHLDLSAFFSGLSKLAERNGQIFSQLGQEIFVISQMFGIDDPKFLEIGAFDPEHFSNTAGLRKYFNWKGYFVDPNPETAKKFTDAGLRDSFIEAAVTNTHEPTLFFHAEGAMSSTSGLRRTAKEIEVKAIHIRKLIELVKQVDYLSLDIEGNESEILFSYPWDLSKPAVVTVEHNHRIKEKDEIQKFMETLGYREFLPSLTDFESWFVKR